MSGVDAFAGAANSASGNLSWCGIPGNGTVQPFVVWPTDADTTVAIPIVAAGIGTLRPLEIVLFSTVATEITVVAVAKALLA